jgi:ubiquinone/menaquinone biosynthesis C-methylase UbiE
LGDDSQYVWEEIWRTDDYGSPAMRTSKALDRAAQIRRMLGPRVELGKVVELACGDGSLANVLLSNSQWGVRTYVGIDRSSTAVSRAREKLASFKNVTLRQEDVLQLRTSPGPADTVIACGLAEHIVDVESAVSVMRAICGSHGRLIITVSNKLSLMYVARKRRELLGTWPYGYQKNYTPNELHGLLARHFATCSIEVTHGHWDFPFSTLCDRVGRMFSKNIGRYIFALAQPRP